MRLNNELYNIISHWQENGEHRYTLELCPGSMIYKAHFPGMPITPGACITQIAMELTEDAVGTAVVLVNARNVKFLSPITPDHVRSVVYTLNIDATEEALKVRAVVSADDGIYAKMTLTCKKP